MEFKRDIYDIITFFEERESKEEKPENFIEFLDTYIAQVSNFDEKNLLLEFFQQYEYCIDIQTEFPKYIKMKIQKEIEEFDITSEKLIPLKYFKLDDEDTFYNYVQEKELKYFTSLIPRPVSLILQHELSPDERELFNGILFNVFNFKYQNEYARFDLADNFQEVYREWIKEL